MLDGKTGTLPASYVVPKVQGWQCCSYGVSCVTSAVSRMPSLLPSSVCLQHQSISWLTHAGPAHPAVDIGSNLRRPLLFSVFLLFCSFRHTCATRLRRHAITSLHMLGHSCPGGSALEDAVGRCSSVSRGATASPSPPLLPPPIPSPALAMRAAHSPCLLIPSMAVVTVRAKPRADFRRM